MRGDRKLRRVGLPARLRWTVFDADVLAPAVDGGGSMEGVLESNKKESVSLNSHVYRTENSILMFNRSSARKLNIYSETAAAVSKVPFSCHHSM